MTIPANLTHAEVGIFLVAVGRQMIERDLAFGAVLDGHSDAELINEISRELLSWIYVDFDDEERAKELIKLTGEEAINFNEKDV